jgi:hypothetical protein
MLFVVLRCEAEAHEIKSCEQYAKERLVFIMSFPSFKGVTGLNLDKLKYTVHRAETDHSVIFWGTVPKHLKEDIRYRLRSPKDMFFTPCKNTWHHADDDEYLFYLATRSKGSKCD